MTSRTFGTILKLCLQIMAKVARYALDGRYRIDKNPVERL